MYEKSYTNFKIYKKIDKPILFNVTLTAYKNEIEPNVPPKGKIIEAIKELSNLIDSDKIVIRYDSVFISDKYNLYYHQKAFDRLCSLLDGVLVKY